MKCVQCGFEQASGKFCGKCGNAFGVADSAGLEEGVNQLEPSVAATVESAPIVTSAHSAQSEQTNKHINQVKETSKMYFNYVTEFMVRPSRIFNDMDRQFTNSIITIALLLLMASYTLFSAVKSVYKETISSFGGLLGTDMPELPFLPLYGRLFMLFFAIIGLSFAISFAVAKLSKQPLNFKQLISIYGTLLLPVVGVVVLAFLLVQMDELMAGMVVLVFGILLAIFMYPLRLAYHNFGGPSKLDSTHRGLIYFGSYSLVLYIIITKYVMDMVGEVREMLEMF